jgi:hypothetical protein
MKKMNITSSEEFASVNHLFNSVPCTGTFYNNVHWYLKQGALTVEFLQVDVEQSMWDGEILFNLTDKIPMTEVINNLIGESKADEISLESNNVLRLWWD